MIKIAITDDDAEAAARLNEFIIHYFKKMCIEKTSYYIDKYLDGEELLRATSNERYDIIFLDIKMQNMDGMSVAFEIRKFDENVVIIFITHMAQFAIDGYSVGAFDYILKPLDYYTFEMRFIKALNRINKKMEKRIEISPVGEGKCFLNFADIKYVEIFGRKLVFHTKQRDYVMNGRLKEIAQKLDDSNFIYANRFSLVNINYVERIKNGGLTIGSEQIPISRNRRAAVLMALSNRIS